MNTTFRGQMHDRVRQSRDPITSDIHLHCVSSVCRRCQAAFISTGL